MNDVGICSAAMGYYIMVAQHKSYKVLTVNLIPEIASNDQWVGKVCNQSDN